ncbi:MAG TPA: ThuA domain-containing protein [Cyclobacteriaceae bacterium]|nr:ThuA domain-containing protein [Cyclobacteriaceae bacterium]
MKMFLVLLRKFVFFALLLTTAGISCTTDRDTGPIRILVFSKTSGYRHESIPDGIVALRKMADEHHLVMDTTENAANFNEENLRNYHVVIFLSTTMDVLNKQQQNDFERFIQAGGGYVGIHAAADTEYDWPWYNGLVGAYFSSHPNNPNVREAEFYVTDPNHPATQGMPERFKRTDEFYNYKSIKDDLHVLVKIDESTYEGGTNGDNHPFSWYHEYDGGRAFYTGMGHTKETYTEPLFLNHLWGGLSWVLGGEKPKKLNFSKVSTPRVPDENRFTKVILDESLDEPVELVVFNDNRVLFIERKGDVKLYTPEDGKVQTIYHIEVSHHYKNPDNARNEAEDGLLGLNKDPNFEKNHWIYMYYSKPGDKAVNILTRWDFVDNKLIPESEKVILEVTVQRDQCCHTGGSIDWDANGNLYLGTGDNSSPRATAYAPLDERPGRSPWDSQKGSSNTNDLRGKVIRIHPEPDGTYTIPEGNLFPKGMEKTRPEIYAMGTRNAYRISVDKKTGYLYWGDVGPDARKDSAGVGPNAYDEINQARKPGFFGWPYFVGDNKAYNDYDFATNTSGPKFDPEKPINESPNNTGLRELPPAQKAFIWYPYGRSEEFPLVGTGGRTAMAGPVFYSEDFKGAKRAFPEYFNGKLFIYEWIRGWIMAVTMDKDGNYVEMEHFMPSYKFSNPMDMAFGPDGDLYMLEYGTGWFQQNENARLIRIEYNGGNRKPQIQMAASKPKGAVPLAVDFSPAGTKDFDRDELSYTWTIKSSDGKELATFNETNPSYTFKDAGLYTATLTVKDGKGESSSGDLTIQAGNEPPELKFDITDGNKTFFFPNTSFSYNVEVTDKEDGSLADGKISPDEVAVTVDYLKEGFDKVEIAMGHQAADASAIEFGAAMKLIDGSDCKSCHLKDAQSVGPMFIAIAEKYKHDPKAVDYLSDKIIKGGSGTWGEVAMAPHPNFTKEQTSQIAKYILSLGQEKAIKTLPVKGTYRAPAENQGVLIARASYQDKGANGVPGIRTEQTYILQAPQLSASDAPIMDQVNKMTYNRMDMMIGTNNGAYIGFEHIDLTDISQMTFAASASKNYGFQGGTVEVHLDAPDGELIGTSSAIIPSPTVGGQPSVVKAAIKPTEGFHNLYFVYRNPAKQGSQSLFILFTINMSSHPKSMAMR